MTQEQNVVHIIDDDDLLVETICLAFDTVNIQYSCYKNAEQFIDAFPADAFASMSGCLLCDIRMPGIGGLECQRQLNALNSALPIIFMTGFADVEMAVETIRSGAFNFVEKPFRHQKLIDTVQSALKQNASLLSERKYMREIERAINTLSNRENTVLELLIDGYPNKSIAKRLDISLRTVEVHRSRIFEKMAAKNVAELVKKIMIVKQNLLFQ
ncbi:response regulator transcription factor [Alteromonas hispanica]|uniref:Response regulator n=1 Tax=Alteromonas hispanica TaxID=315421 RepID=A0A6L9MU71_9ALTE|nr:response regulator [Alteromonas hispanica]NDW21736.1 response regulator [Alteromonas hispanica]